MDITLSLESGMDLKRDGALRQLCNLLPVGCSDCADYPRTIRCTQALLAIGNCVSETFFSVGAMWIFHSDTKYPVLIPSNQSENRRDHGDSSVVRAWDSSSKGLGFESRQERWENFPLRGQLSVLTLFSVSVPPPCYCSST